MTVKELEKEVKEIKENVDDLNKKVDLLVEELKDKDSIRGAFKESYQLFVAAIVGATSGVLIGAYVKYPSFWFAVVIIASLFGISVFFSLAIRYTFRKRIGKEK